METKQEFSSGGVVYKQEDKSYVYLLGKHSGYHKWVLPKGMIEAGETPEQTAIRETEEEIGVAARIVQPNPIHIEKYSYQAELKEQKAETVKDPKKDEATRRVKSYQEAGGKGVLVHKTVTFYLMEWVSGNPSDHGWEMEDAGWFPVEKALEIMSFEGEKKALTIANQILTS